MTAQSQNLPAIQLAISVFLSAAVVFVLKSISDNMAGNAEGTIKWATASFLIILFTLFIIFYILDYVPSSKEIFIKLGIIIFSTLAFLGFSRYHMFLNIRITPTEVAEESVRFSYVSWLTFLAVIGCFLIIQGLSYRKEQKSDKWKWGFFIAIGSIIFCISIIFAVFVSPGIPTSAIGGGQ